MANFTSQRRADSNQTIILLPRQGSREERPLRPQNHFPSPEYWPSVSYFCHRSTNLRCDSFICCWVEPMMPQACEHYNSKCADCAQLRSGPLRVSLPFLINNNAVVGSLSVPFWFSTVTQPLLLLVILTLATSSTVLLLRTWYICSRRTSKWALPTNYYYSLLQWVCPPLHIPLYVKWIFCNFLVSL